jgi:threonine dehydratase
MRLSGKKTRLTLLYAKIYSICLLYVILAKNFKTSLPRCNRYDCAMDLAYPIVKSEEHIRPFIRETPLEFSPTLSTDTCSVYLKLENYQHTGSFKVRGAFNKLLSLSEKEKANGIVTASTGNHGAATAYALKMLHAKGIIFVPENASKAKVSNIKRFGAEVQFYGQDGVETEYHARQFALENAMTYVSPYNDERVVAGQGSIGVELSKQLDTIDNVLVALGGGGLISGIALYLKSINPKVNIIACSPQNSAVMMESMKAGKILDLPSLPTFSDGTAGGVEANAITFELCRDLVDDYITVTEEEIKTAWRDFLGVHHMMIEGAAAMVVACLQKMQTQLKGNTVLIICGANVSLDVLREVIA